MKLEPIANNQTQVKTHNMAVLFSYNTPVAAMIDGKYYRTAKKWSKTTSKHINQWLDGVNAETKPQEFFNNLLDEGSP